MLYPVELRMHPGTPKLETPSTDGKPGFRQTQSRSISLLLLPVLQGYDAKESVAARFFAPASIKPGFPTLFASECRLRRNYPATPPAVTAFANGSIAQSPSDS